MIFYILIFLLAAISGCLGPGSLCSRNGECCVPLVCQFTNKGHAQPMPGYQSHEGVNHLHEKLLLQLPNRYSSIVPSHVVSVPMDKNRTQYHMAGSDLRQHRAKRCERLPVLIDTNLVS
eukprot:Gregarina_sp_Poly_1__24@NODE_1004_length_5397_cov_173_232270_g704_i0_p7_GENE_NODE_1004_length_5397_cov_173_232270_g704_i0NODE_1004_length_5397_cov_173_232270_g704_i0_p7_ORF_typecomplete_len119_score3_63Toxin_12/PF07740_12/0_12_NODE_1004_length_5397_cov_173_232270_g704_i026593015